MDTRKKENVARTLLPGISRVSFPALQCMAVCVSLGWGKISGVPGEDGDCSSQRVAVGALDSFIRAVWLVCCAFSRSR